MRAIGIGISEYCCFCVLMRLVDTLVSCLRPLALTPPALCADGTSTAEVIVYCHGIGEGSDEFLVTILRHLPGSVPAL